MSPSHDEGYAAATEGVAVFDRSERTRLTVRGRAPAQMLSGILTGTMPGAPVSAGETLAGRATYHAVLTPKGKMLSDLWCLLLGDEADPGFLLDVPAAGREALVAHLGKFLPPRLAKVEDVSESTGSVAVAGPDAADVLSRLALGLRADPSELQALAEGEWRAVGASAAESLVVMRTRDVWPDAYVVLGPRRGVAALEGALVEAGAVRAPAGVWEVLRVEAGRPEYGVDMDEGTIPVEADIHDRAIDYEKGCYTGQEVIVRIRDRGHVNRTLRRVELGDAPVPEPGTELFEVGADKAGAVVTSAVRSPRFGQTVALAYVRRGVAGALEPRG